MGTRLHVFLPAISPHLSIPCSTLYLAENVDNVTPFECQFIGNISGAVPHTLVEISIICFFIAWGRKRCIHEALSVYVAEVLIVKAINTLPLKEHLRAAAEHFSALGERVHPAPSVPAEVLQKRWKTSSSSLRLEKHIAFKSMQAQVLAAIWKLNTRAYLSQEACLFILRIKLLTWLRWPATKTPKQAFCMLESGAGGGGERDWLLCWIFGKGEVVFEIQQYP